MQPSLLRSLRFLVVLLVAVLALPAWAAGARAQERDATRRTAAEALADGRRLAHGGWWEDAVEAFTEATADGGDTGLTARFELARVYDRMGNEPAAADTLAELVGYSPTAEPVLRGWFLYGSVLNDLGRHEEAARAYVRYIELGGPAAAYARVEHGRELNELGDREGALAALRPLLEGAGPVHARRRALRLAGSIEAEAGRLDRAIAHYQALHGLTTSGAERILALSRAGDLQCDIGDHDACAETLRTLAARYPQAPEAEEALGRLESIGRPADPLTAGIVHYRRRNNTRARELLNAYLRASGAAGPGAAAALFYLGALAERRDDTRLALENYQEAYDADPTGRLAPEALYERANVLAYSGRTDEARSAFALVTERFPSSPRAAEAAFRAGWVVYQAGRTQEARSAWSAAMFGNSNAGAARAAFWAGRAAAEMGDGGAGRLAYLEAVRRDPTGYYGLRAAAVLAGEPRAPASGRGIIYAVPQDWAAAEAWLTGWAGPEEARLWATISASEDWRAARELLEAGWHRTGSEAMETLIFARAEQPWTLYRMARELDAGGYPYLTYVAGATLLAAGPSPDAPQAAAIARLAYPAPWQQEVQQFADQHGVDPLLLYALIRQESTFNPTAGSSAGAYGLTQVIPGTAQEIARGLGRTPFRFDDLTRPAVAIEFGAYYLGAQTRHFGGNVYQALAAYNGGAGNASRWARSGGAADVDRFYEEVDYPETKTYLRLVLQYYAWYRYLNGVTAQPSLAGR